MHGVLLNDSTLFDHAHGRGITARREVRADAVVLLGMPHLTANGLSENWLLRELGHRHWLLLAELAGMSVPRFIDRQHNPVYAAFCAVSIARGDFGRAKENDRLRISSSLARISRTQIESRHRLAMDDALVGIVTMVSTFVCRTARGNHAIARAAVTGLPSLDRAAARSPLAGLAADMRAGRIGSHMGFDPGLEKTVASVAFEPCPSLDFNGAGFLYFANFVALADRTEWQFDRDAATCAATVDRDVFFYGNIDRGETVSVRLQGWKRDAHQIAHHFRMCRGSDGRVIADVFSRRALTIQ